MADRRGWLDRLATRAVGGGTPTPGSSGRLPGMGQRPTGNVLAVQPGGRSSGGGLSAATQPITYASPGQPMWLEWDAQRAVDQGYYASLWVMRCVRTIADTVAGLPFRAGASADEPANFDPEAPLAKLLGPAPGAPNPKTASRALWAWSVVQYLVTGRFGWEIQRDPGARGPDGKPAVAGFWPLVSAGLQPIPSIGKAQWWDGFIYQTPMGAVPMGVDQVAYSWRSSARDFRQPESYLEAANLAVSIEVGIQRFMWNLLKNGLAGTYLVVTPPFEESDMRRAWQDQFLQEFTGFDNAGKTIFGEAEIPEAGARVPNIQVEKLGTNPVDAQLLQMWQQAKIDITVALGVPESLIGNASQRTYANADSEYRNFWTLTMLTILRELEDHINTNVAPLVGEEVGWFDLSNVVALQAPTIFTPPSIKDAIDEGVATASDVANILGIPDAGASVDVDTAELGEEASGAGGGGGKRASHRLEFRGRSTRTVGQQEWRAVPIETRAVAAPSRSDLADKVYGYLARNYPDDTLDWVHDAEWQGPKRVPLDQIQMDRRPGGRDDEKTQGIAKAIQAGKPMDPVVLVNAPGSDKLKVADGYHRTLAHRRAGRATVAAFVGKTAEAHGAWEREMHDRKLNRALTLALASLPPLERRALAVRLGAAGVELRGPAPDSKRMSPLRRPHRCKFGKHSATKAIVWAEGRAFVPTCDDHYDQAVEKIGGPSQVDKVYDLPTETRNWAEFDAERAGRAPHVPGARIVAPPRHSWMREHDCVHCGHESLKKPVWIDRGGGPEPFGTDHAAQTLGLSPRGVTRKRDELLGQAQQQAQADDERVARYSRAVAAFDQHGSAVVQHDASGSTPEADFNRLRLEHGKRDPSLIPPAAFAEHLRRRIGEIQSGTRALDGLELRYDVSPLGEGKNWVTDVGGLPLFIRAIAHALIRNGHSESDAIQIAVGTVQRWARGQGKVTPKTRAKAAAALAEWEAKKVAAHATRDGMGGVVTEAGSAGALLPVGQPRPPKPRQATMTGPHAFTGTNPAACAACGMPAAAQIHRTGRRRRRVIDARSFEAGVIVALADPPLETRVGPKGYIHGWIFVGVPVEGDRVRHPWVGHGTVHRVQDFGNNRKIVRVQWDHGAYTTHEAIEHPGTPRLVPPHEAPRFIPKPPTPPTPPKAPEAPRAPERAPEIPRPRPAPEIPVPERPAAGTGAGGIKLPSKGFRKLSADEVRRHLTAKAEFSNPSLGPAAHLRADVLQREVERVATTHETHIGADGTLVHFHKATKVSEAKKATALRTVEGLRRTYPEKPAASVFVGSGMANPFTGRTRRFGPGVKAYAIKGSPKIWVSPQATKTEDEGRFKRAVEMGHFMPAGSGKDPLEYYLAHEYGHTIDRPGTTSRSVETSAHLSRINANPDLSLYGKTSQSEAYAEAFAEWHSSGGKTTNPTVRKLAHAEGWKA